MKKLLTCIFVFSGILLGRAQTHQLEKIWESKEQLTTPESVLYDEQQNWLYVSLIDGSGSEKDGKGGVALLNLDGTIKNAEWLTGLNAPKGLARYKNKLYIADITSVVIADALTGKIKKTIEIPESTFLNDVAVDTYGVVYVSDTRDNKIYAIKEGEVSLYLDNVPSINGLKVVDNKLLALAGKEFWEIDANKKVKVFTKGFEQGGDGLEPVGNGDYLVTCWPGIIYYVNADGTFKKIQDVQGQMNTADLGYNPKEKILYIPTFNSNSVIAYKLK